MQQHDHNLESLFILKKENNQRALEQERKSHSIGNKMILIIITTGVCSSLSGNLEGGV